MARLSRVRRLESGIGLAFDPESWGRARRRTSALPLVDSRVDGLEPATGDIDFHAPVNLPPVGVATARPRCDFRTQGPEVASATTSQALAGHGAEFALPDVASPDALRQLAELDPMRQLGRPRRLLHGAERSLRVHAETVRRQRDPLACVVTALRQRFHCRLPVRFLGHRLHGDRASPVRLARRRDSGRIPGPSP